MMDQHAAFVRNASRTAEKRIVVTSHRIGPPARNAVLIPVATAAQSKGISAEIYFGQPSDTGDGRKAADLTMEAKNVGVRIAPIFEPKVHAKVLARDDDFVVITSQNWLSADPSEGNLRREMGVYLKAPGIGRRFIEKFKFECGAS
jgi:phosphatidylserine/phosphatidylglycerophosphate/cardiolipin synthase-like enzyme